MREVTNQMMLKIDSRSVNESFARSTAAAFAAQLDPTIEEINDIKTAVSEAVTNAIVHGYKDGRGYINIEMRIYKGGTVGITVRDRGCGIENVPKALEPLYTTGDSDRSGMGFTIMESFMDKLQVNSRPGSGTTVKMEKKIMPRFSNANG